MTYQELKESKNNDVIYELGERILKMIDRNNKRAGYVWYTVIIAFFVFGLTSYEFTQLISFLFFSTKNIEELKEVIVGTGPG